MNNTTAQILDDCQMRVVAEFSPFLRSNNLETFGKVMAAESQAYARKFPGRNTVRMELKSPDGAGNRVIYLKRYEPAYLSSWTWFLRAIHWPNADDEAAREWRMLHRLRELGFNTANPIAMGQKKSGGVVTRSFVMTEEISGVIQADDYCRSLNATERRRFVEEFAMWARKFHDTGMVHRDFYISHFFVVKKGDSRKLFVIDLQRVFQPRVFRERWVVKDIGSLGYSALKAGATRTDLMRFVKIYLAKKHLKASDKKFIRKLLGRIAWLQTRVPKHG